MLSFVLTLLWIVGLPTFLLWAKLHVPSIPVIKPDRVAFAIAVTAAVIDAIRRRNRLPRPGRVELAMAVYLAVIAVSWCLTLPGKSLLVFKQDADFLLTCFLMPYAAFVIAKNTEWTSGRLTACLWLLVGGVGTYLLFFGVMQYVYSWSFLVPTALEQFQPDRAKGPFENAVPYGMVLSVFVLLALMLYVRSRSTLQRLALVAIALGLVQSIVASKTRAAWLALPLALLLPSIRYSRMRLLSAVLILDVAAQVLLLPLLMTRRQAAAPAATVEQSATPSTGGDFRGLKERLVEPDPLYDRAAVFQIASKMIADRPLAGFGFGESTFETYKRNYYAAIGSAAPYAEYPNNPHNDLLNVLVMMGVVGLLGYLALLWTGWHVVWSRSSFRSPVVEMAPFVQGVFIVVLVAGGFHSAMHMSYVQVLFFFLLGMAASGQA